MAMLLSALGGVTFSAVIAFGSGVALGVVAWLSVGSRRWCGQRGLSMV